MNIIRVADEAQLSEKAAAMIAAQIRKKPDAVLGLATGSTPVGTYQELIRKYEAGKLDFSGVTTFNLDEYVGAGPEDPHGYMYFMRKQLFDHVNIRKEQTNIPDGCCTDAAAECEQYDRRIRAAGGIDLQLLGIGANGHIAFNEPAEQLIYGTHKEQLTASTIAANARFFRDKSEVPTQALSMGIGIIMEAEQILLLGGAGKQRIIEQMLASEITTRLPASLLKLHRAVTIIYIAQ